MVQCNLSNILKHVSKETNGSALSSFGVFCSLLTGKKHTFYFQKKEKKKEDMGTSVWFWSPHSLIFFFVYYDHGNLKQMQLYKYSWDLLRN